MTDTPPESVVALLQRMVRFDTVNAAVSGRSKPEAELTAYLEALAADASLTTRRLPVEGQGDNLLVLHEARPGAPWLLFDSHLDTVGVVGMTIDPFGADIRDGKLFGRGACDTKGTGAAMFWALRRYAESAEQPNNIAMLFSVDEEIGMTGISSFCASDLPELGFDIAGAVVGEPTWLNPVTAHNGVLRWDVTTRGVAAHSSAPQLGRSAISDMMKVVQAVESRYVPGLAASHPLTGQAVCSVNVIRGGVQVNVIPVECTVEIDRRLVPGEELDDVSGDLGRLIETLAEADPKLDARVTVETVRPTMETDPASPWAAAVLAALAAMDMPADPKGAPFATHGGDLSRAGVPTVVIGPGNPFPAHTKDEYVDLDQIEKGVEVYLALMRAGLDG